MRYQIRPGIVRTQICGAYYLIPTRKAADDCPSIMRLSIFTASAWELLEKDREQDIYRVYEILTKKTAEESRAHVDKLLADLCARGYLIEAEDDAG